MPCTNLLTSLLVSQDLISCPYNCTSQESGSHSWPSSPRPLYGIYHQSLSSFSKSVQLLSHIRLFATPWTAALQASLSISNTQSLLKLMSFELVMPSKHLILRRSLLLPTIFPSIRDFFNKLALLISGQSIGTSPSASILPMNIQDWLPLRLTGWISLQSKGFLEWIKVAVSKI